jgi:glycosyltransferase involved in cell wall biosynthesis
VTIGPDAPLRVAVDAGPVIEERSGVGHTTASLLMGLGARPDVDVSGYAISRTGREELAQLLPPGVRAATSWIPARVAHRCWRRVSWPPLERWAGPVDVVHATNFIAPPARAAVVVTVHDMAFARFPELCRPATLEYDALLRRAIDRGATVHTVSDHVAAEVREHFGLRDERVVRVYYGVDRTGADGDAARGRSRAGSDRYILSVGTIEPRKNYARLVRAFRAVASADPTLTLVIAGARGWGVESFDHEITRADDVRIRVLGYVSDRDRADLLAGAAVLAYPSLYEGFGHPPFEAMAARVPVVAGHGGALPEALGDAALLVDPYDEDELANALARACGDQLLRTELVARGLERVQDFPWNRAVAELTTLYRQLAG